MGGASSMQQRCFVHISLGYESFTLPHCYGYVSLAEQMFAGVLPFHPPLHSSAVFQRSGSSVKVLKLVSSTSKMQIFQVDYLFVYHFCVVIR